MTKILYMDNIEGNYIKEFDATVVKKKGDKLIIEDWKPTRRGGKK